MRLFITSRGLTSGLCMIACLIAVSLASAQTISNDTVEQLNQALSEAKDNSSEARQRLAVRRVIRDAQELVDANANDPQRFQVLDFLFRAQQQLIALDKDPKHRAALLETCKQLVKAPEEYAHLSFEADLLLTQTELAKKGADAEERAKALMPLVERYVETPAGAKVLRVAMTIALELGDTRLVNDLRDMISERYPADLEMINFQRDKLGGQVLGAPFAGTFKRSDGKVVRLPMDALGRVSMMVFWSKEGEGLEYIKGLAAASKEAKDEINGRMQFFSINVDELPDAGESIIRKAGVDWQVLHLPGGRANPIYKTYARTDPQMMRVTPTGQTALVMSGVGRERLLPDGSPDFHRYFNSALARGWSRQEYAMQVAALTAGDFFVFEPDGKLDPSRPPELKAAAAGGKVKPLQRTVDSVPEETLTAIQEAIVAPPQRYRMSYPEAEASYGKLAGLCRKALAAHPNAPDLWIVRNRLIVAELGLWKTTGLLEHFEAAVAEAEKVIDAGYPDGCDVVAQFCVTRNALRDATGNSGQIIDRFVKDQGGDSASGHALAAALLLSLDVADRMRIEKFRDAILSAHTEYPMMWVFASVLLDRHHSYWMFQVPFTAGWSYGRRENYYMNRGRREDAARTLNTELKTADGRTLRIPEDLDKQWTIITFSQPAPWQKKRDDGLPASPHRNLHQLAGFVEARPDDDVEMILATFGGGAEASQAELTGNRNKVECRVVNVPEDAGKRLLIRLGILSEDDGLNSVLIRKDGRIGGVVSGLSGGATEPLQNMILVEDEKEIVALLEDGRIEEAKKKVMALAPPYDPEAVDEKGRKLRKPKHSTPHLRARARVYMALGEMEKALADAEEVYSRTFSESGGMSMRTEELDEAEALRDKIQEEMK